MLTMVYLVFTFILSTIHYPPFTIHHPLFTIHHPLFTTHQRRIIQVWL